MGKSPNLHRSYPPQCTFHLTQEKNNLLSFVEQYLIQTKLSQEERQKVILDFEALDVSSTGAIEIASLWNYCLETVGLSDTECK